MASKPSAKKKAEWKARAAVKNGIVPHYFEVFATKVIIECGVCHHRYTRPLIPNLDEPIFVCPNGDCKARNWVPVRFDLR